MSKKELEEGTEESAFAKDIVINGVLYPNNIESDRRIDRTLLEDEFEAHSAKYAYYSTLAALSRAEEATLKVDMENAYAIADRDARQDARAAMEQDPKMKFTEKMYESVAKTSAPFQQARKLYLAAKAQSDLLSRWADAMAHRKEMLISLGAHARIGAQAPRVLAQNVRALHRKEEPVKEEVVSDIDDIAKEIERPKKKKLVRRKKVKKEE